MTPDQSLVLFDGYCNLCSSSVMFIIKRDPAARFKFAPLSSEQAQQILQRIGAARSFPGSMILLEKGKVHTRSAATLRIAKGMRFPWPLAYAAIVIPRPLRDWLYDIVAANRYRWFGRRETCMMPSQKLRARFLA